VERVSAENEAMAAATGGDDGCVTTGRERERESALFQSESQKQTC